ncbi:MAG: hypothetical protein WCB31_07455 [Nitrososphaeraceae archaeon]
MIFKENSFKEILSNQFLLLIVGGILTGLLIPYITTQWQNHEKELEIKTGLVSKISEHVTRMLMAIQFVEVSQSRGINSSLTNEEYDNEYRDWKINSDIIQSQINAYFPSIDIDKSWKKFSNAVEYFYALSGTSSQDSRINFLKKIETNLSNDINLTTWNILKNKISPSNDTKEIVYWEEKWGALKDQINEEKENIIQKILNTKINL